MILEHSAKVPLNSEQKSFRILSQESSQLDYLLSRACVIEVGFFRAYFLNLTSFFQTTDPGVGPGGNTHSEGVLANFFNSLLSKNTGQTRSPGTTPNKVAGASDDCKFLLFI